MNDFEAGPIHWRQSIRTTIWRPPTDVYETDEMIVVRMEIGGMREDDFIIELDGRILSIRGQRGELRSDISERRAYHQMEIRYGEFSCELEIPAAVDVQRVEAEYRNGFLRVNLPKASPKHVHIDES